MNVILHKKPFHYIEVTDMYTSNEYKKMMYEMCQYEEDNLLLPPDVTGTAIDTKNNILKSNTGLWIDDIFYRREYSKILTLNRKLFDLLGSDVTHDSWFFKRKHIDKDCTLISYYENSDYYKPHIDAADITALTWFYKKPKKFKGGDLIFTEYDIKIKCKQNYTIIFPSNIEHQVTEISIDKEYRNNHYGRFTMTQFLMNENNG